MMKSSKRIDYIPGMFDKYKAEPDLDSWCYEFPEVMWALGYEMDCCHSFEVYADDCKLGLKTPQNDKEKKRNILYMLEHADRQIVGNYLFSYWRYLTHWTMYGYDEYEVDFVKRIIKILEDKYVFDGNGLKSISENVALINKVVVESIVPYFLVSTEEQCKQRLIINTNGSLTLTKYYKVSDSEDAIGRRIVRRCKKNCVEQIIRYLSVFFDDQANMPIGNGSDGSWWVEFKSSNGEKRRFIGGFSDSYSVRHSLISPLIRYDLNCPELWLFDGKSGDDDFIVGKENDTIQSYVKKNGYPKMKFLGENFNYRYYLEDNPSDDETGIPFVIMEYKKNNKFSVCDSYETFKALDDFWLT